MDKSSLDAQVAENNATKQKEAEINKAYLQQFFYSLFHFVFQTKFCCAMILFKRWDNLALQNDALATVVAEHNKNTLKQQAVNFRK